MRKSVLIIALLGMLSFSAYSQFTITSFNITNAINCNAGVGNVTFSLSFTGLSPNTSYELYVGSIRINNIQTNGTGGFSGTGLQGNGLACSGDYQINIYPQNSNPSSGAPVGSQNTASLPVTWAYVKGFVENQQVVLKWATAQEDGNSGFEIQRLVEGQFKPIGWIEGHGTTRQQKVYSFVDRTAQTGDHIYRLRQVDYDGKFAFSNLISVSLTEQASVLAYPIPAHNNVTVQTPAGSVLQVYNAVGQLVATEKTTDALHLLDIQYWASGMYHVSVQLPDGSAKNLRLQKQ